MNLNNIFIVISVQIVLVFSQNADSNNAGKDVKTLTEKAYAKLFKERRLEGKELLRIIKDEGVYERKYKLLEGAYEKLLNKKSKVDFSPVNLIHWLTARDARLLDALTVTLENTCLFGELILHNPDISYRVLESRQNAPAWKQLINWCIKFTRQFNDRIIDKKSQELLWLAEQEINPEKRTEDFINPYRNTADDKNSLKKKKK